MDSCCCFYFGALLNSAAVSALMHVFQCTAYKFSRRYTHSCEMTGSEDMHSSTSLDSASCFPKQCTLPQAGSIGVSPLLFILTSTFY